MTSSKIIEVTSWLELIRSIWELLLTLAHLWLMLIIFKQLAAEGELIAKPLLRNFFCWILAIHLLSDSRYKRIKKHFNLQ